MLRRYVDVRLEFYQADINQRKLQKVDDDTERLHKALWSHTIVAGGQDPRAIPTGLFIQSLNDVIDHHAKRVTVLENHVPESVLILLCIFAILSLGLVGYGAGMGMVYTFTLRQVEHLRRSVTKAMERLNSHLAN